MTRSSQPRARQAHAGLALLWLALTAALAVPACQDVEPTAIPTFDPPGMISRRTVTYITPATKVGVNVHSDLASATKPWLVGTNGLGVRLVRYAVNFFDGPPQYFRPLLSAYDSAGTTQQVDVLATVSYFWRDGSAPTGAAYTHCASQPGHACIPSPTSRAWTDTLLPDFEKYVDTLITRNAGTVKYWSFWNEPNEPSFFNGDSAQYDVMARIFCRVVHRENRICVGPEYAMPSMGFDSADTFIPDSVERHLNRALAIFARDSFDVLALHVYERFEKISTLANRVHSLGGPNLWITETGPPHPNYRSSAADPEFQERDVGRKANAMVSGENPYIGALFMYDLQTMDAGLLTNSPNGTLVSSSTQWVPRPAFYALKNAMSSTYYPSSWGYCSTATSYASCDYTTLFAAESDANGYFRRFDCVLTAFVHDQSGVGVSGVIVRGYQGNGQWGEKLTNWAGKAKFNSPCTPPGGIGNGLMIIGPLPYGFTGPYPWYHHNIFWSDTVKVQSRTFLVEGP